MVKLETEYWKLLNVPKQEKQEPVGTYVLRACVALEKVQLKPSEKASVDNEERIREEKERLEGERNEEKLFPPFLFLLLPLLLSSSSSPTLFYSLIRLSSFFCTAARKVVHVFFFLLLLIHAAIALLRVEFFK